MQRTLFVFKRTVEFVREVFANGVLAHRKREIYRKNINYIQIIII